MEVSLIPHSSDWQKELLESYTSLEQLHRDGFIPEISRDLKDISKNFRIRIPKYYANLFGEKDCPIRLQALPSHYEKDPELPRWIQNLSLDVFGRNTPWLRDAIGDEAHLAAPRLTHRYGNRAILHLSSLCGLYCRFCFRKTHLNERTLYEGTLDLALKYLRETSEINELILTGGDPLSLNDTALDQFLEKLRDIPHLVSVRFHTRMPVTLPSRLTHNLLQTLLKHRFHFALVSHFNHPKELTDFALERLKYFKDHGIVLYNQSVLLRNINDCGETLGALFQKLYFNGITPMYLHHPDLTEGTFHFRVSIQKGRELMRGLSGLLSGPALPQYVLDIPTGFGKIGLMDTDLVRKKLEKNADGFAVAVYEFQNLPQTRAKNKKCFALFRSSSLVITSYFSGATWHYE